jgi:hypothetical protein
MHQEPDKTGAMRDTDFFTIATAAGAGAVFGRALRRAVRVLHLLQDNGVGVRKVQAGITLVPELVSDRENARVARRNIDVVANLEFQRQIVFAGDFGFNGLTCIFAT